MKTFEEKFTAWVDGKLSGRELADFENEIAAMADAQSAQSEKLAAQKVRGRAERLDLEPDRAKQTSERLAHRFTIVDDEYDRLFGISGLTSWMLYHDILSGQEALQQ